MSCVPAFQEECLKQQELGQGLGVCVPNELLAEHWSENRTQEGLGPPMLQVLRCCFQLFSGSG